VKKVLAVLAVAGLASGAMAQPSFDGTVGFSQGHTLGGPFITEATVGAGTHQFTVALGAFNAQGFTNYGMFNWTGNLSETDAGVSLGNSPGNRQPYTQNPVGNGVVGPTGISGIDAAHNGVINRQVAWPVGQPMPEPPTLEGANSLFRTFRFTVNVTDDTIRDVVISADGIMQAIAGWTVIDPGEEGANTIFTATSFVTDATANGSFVLHIVPAPGAAALLGLGGLVAARRRR